jgi:hypothetical protein
MYVDCLWVKLYKIRQRVVRYPDTNVLIIPCFCHNIHWYIWPVTEYRMTHFSHQWLSVFKKSVPCFRHPELLYWYIFMHSLHKLHKIVHNGKAMFICMHVSPKLEVRFWRNLIFGGLHQKLLGKINFDLFSIIHFTWDFVSFLKKQLFCS